MSGWNIKHLYGVSFSVNSRSLKIECIVGYKKNMNMMSVNFHGSFTKRTFIFSFFTQAMSI